MSDLDPTQGDAEDVDFKPRRSAPNALTVQQVAQLAPGDSMASRDVLGPQGRTEYISVRTPVGGLRLSMSHYPIFTALWTKSGQKRAMKEDPGVSVADVSEISGASKELVQQVLSTLVRNEIVRRIAVQAGFTGRKAIYLPTERGVELFALAEYLGYGSSIQVGKNETSWGDRSNDEPESFFQWAKLLSGGAVA